MIELHNADCFNKLRELEDNSVDSVVTDPPYFLSFMGKDWDKLDGNIAANVEFWKEVLRVLKPGGHLLAFGHSRTHHRLYIAIEDAGFEIRDTIMWLYGSGFPKSHDISKAIDKHGGSSIAWFGTWLREWREENNISQKQIASLFPSKTGGLTGCVANWELGLSLPTAKQFSLICKTFNLPFETIEEAKREITGSKISGIANKEEKERHTVGASKAVRVDITAPATDEAKRWEGWGTALKPAHEPICLARKPLEGTVATNVLKYGVGGLNIDESRVGTDAVPINKLTSWSGFGQEIRPDYEQEINSSGRWPANIILDEEAGEVLDKQAPKTGNGHRAKTKVTGYGSFGGGTQTYEGVGEKLDGLGGASRFFYCAKVSKKERGVNNRHPTVKPKGLMTYLIKLVTPPGGKVLDPFMGSGSTGLAAKEEGFDFIGIEREPEYFEIAKARIGE